MPRISGWSAPHLSDEYAESPPELMFIAREKINNTAGLLQRIDELLDEMVAGREKSPVTISQIEPLHHKPTGQLRFAEIRLWIRTDSISGSPYGEITLAMPEGEQVIAAIEL